MTQTTKIIVTDEEIEARPLGIDINGGPLSLGDIDAPADRYAAIERVMALGWTSVVVWRSPYDYRVRARDL